MNAQTHVTRLLALVPYLQAHNGVSVNEVAAHFDVSASQVKEDLSVLWMCGLPGGLPDDLINIDMDAVDEDGVVHISNAAYLSRPMRFTPQEAASLLGALSAVRQLATGELADAAASAADKLSAIAGQQGSVMVEIAAGDETVRSALLTALSEGQRVRLTYDGQVRSQTTEPVVDPGAIVMGDAVAYLTAWSVAKQDWRTYRLDRIVDVTPTGESSVDHGPVPPLPDDWFASPADEVVMEFAPWLAWASDYYPARQSSSLADGRVVASFAVADPDWLTALLLRLGQGVRVLQPPDAPTEAVALAKAAIAQTEQVLALNGQPAQNVEQ